MQKMQIKYTGSQTRTYAGIFIFWRNLSRSKNLHTNKIIASICLADFLDYCSILATSFDILLRMKSTSYKKFLVFVSSSNSDIIT